MLYYCFIHNAYVLSIQNSKYCFHICQHSNLDLFLLVGMTVFYPGSSLAMTLKPFLSPFMLGCPPLWHLGKLRGTSYLPRGHFSNMLVSAMQRLFFDVKLATPTQIRYLWCTKGCLNLHSTMEFRILVWYPHVKTLEYFRWFCVDQKLCESYD